MRKSRHIFLKGKVAELELQILTTRYIKNITNIRWNLRLYDYITAGLILRPKASWYEHGEKSSKYFLNLEKRNKAKSHLQKIITDSNTEISDLSAIMCHVKHFYSLLYKRCSTKNEKECLDYMNNFSLPKLKDIEREVCEGLLTREECWDALNAMKNSKSPGNDSLTKEIYVCFFSEICSPSIDALNYSFEVGQLSTSQRQAIITLIEKKDKDKRYIKSWRPISLINVDAKIASKALAARVKKVLASIIKSDQIPYVQSRYNAESICLISNILE